MKATGLLCGSTSSLD